MELTGHLWTIGPRLWRNLRSLPGPPADLWCTTLQDSQVGEIQLTGWLRRCRESQVLLVVVHGLGGCGDSDYAVRAAWAAESNGWSSLRLNLRGADRRGEDFHHAGLTADLHATLASPSLADYRAVFLLGFSLGGHVCLRYAAEAGDPRVQAVATVCAPVDLELTSANMDRPARWLYRMYVLGHLKDIYRQVARRRSVPTPLEQVLRIRTFRDWDEHTVVPRFGFSSAGDYYASQSAGPLLSRLRIPALLVVGMKDPFVSWPTLEPWLQSPYNCVEVRKTERGGHVMFPADLDLGLGAPSGLEPQVLSWLSRGESALS